MLLKIYLLSVLVVGHVLCGNHSNQTETETAPEVEPEVLPEQEPPQSVDVTESSPSGPVEPLDIHGLDNRQTVFHQKHQVPNGNVAGTYGYYDSLGRYHVLNYVQDRHGIRITNDYMPFESPPGSGAEHHRDQRPPDLQEDHEGRPPAGQHEPLAESDGDNLLRDEHSVIRTTVVPPPGSFFNNFGFYQGNDVAGSQVVPYNVHRRNSTQHYNRPFPQALYQQRVPHRIPYPYENPLYPLLYTDPNKNNQGGNQEDDVNDTSGLDSSDGVSEVPSKPIRSRPVSHAPPSVRPQFDAGFANSLYSRPQYQQTNYYHHYSQPSRQQQYLVQPVHQYQGPVRPQAYYPQHHYQQQQYQSYYYQPVVAGYNRYEPYNYGYNHR